MVPNEFKPIELKNPDPFTFLCLADRGMRKGFDLVGSAFYQAFGKSNKVELILKGRENFWSDVRVSHPDNVKIIREDTYDIKTIYSLANCFVFPSRGEGYGLPPRETTAMGIPTIATKAHGTFDVDNWGIPLENYTLVNCRMGGQWFNPDVDELKEKMLWVYNNYENAKNIATMGAKWLQENQTWDHAAISLARLIKYER
jgi:glycosyltransferase involved in cell wall biosynthesis